MRNAPPVNSGRSAHLHVMIEAGAAVGELSSLKAIRHWSTVSDRSRT